MTWLKNELKLSIDSQDFLENLRVYLFSTGKNPDKIDEILEELKVHLLEAEKNGKPIDKIIGKSPKEYMKMISQEMDMDYRTWMKYTVLIILGSFSFTIFADLLEGNLAYSVLEIIGQLVIGGIFLTSILLGFKYISSSGLSIRKQVLVLFPIVLIPLLLHIGLIFINRYVDTPIIQFHTTGSWAIGGITALIVFGISLWAKTLALIIIVALLTLPDYLLGLSSLNPETQLMISPWIMFGGIAVYLFVLNKTEKKKA